MNASESKKPSLLALSAGAIGVVYGDIGTSPLYALKEAFNGPHGATINHDNILGVLSLMLWALILVVSDTRATAGPASPRPSNTLHAQG